MNRVSIYWWNLKKAARKVVVWVGIFYILSAGNAAVLRRFNLPEVIGASVTVVLIIGTLWKLRVAFKEDWWDDEESIKDKKSSDDHRDGGHAPAFCPNCQVSLMADQVDENGMCTRCGGPIQTGDNNNEPVGGEWAWDNDW